MARMKWDRPQRFQSFERPDALERGARAAARKWSYGPGLSAEMNENKIIPEPVALQRSAQLTPAPRTTAEGAKRLLVQAETAEVYCDGGAAPNPGAGGWGVLIEASGLGPVELCGGAPNTTNNRMELQAAIVALEALPIGCRCTITSDSNYLVQGMNQWLANWKRKGWRSVLNRDLWERLDALAIGRAIQWQWCRGHSTTRGNIRADQLATLGRERSLEGDAIRPRKPVALSDRSNETTQ